jgi:hypothetical protein
MWRAEGFLRPSANEKRAAETRNAHPSRGTRLELGDLGSSTSAGPTPDHEMLLPPGLLPPTAGHFLVGVEGRQHRKTTPLQPPKSRDDDL